MVGRFALHEDRTLLLFVFVDDDGAPPASVDEQHKRTLLRRHFASCRWEVPAILDALDRVDDVYLDHVSQIKMPSWSRGRVCLVGDAASCVSLTGGQGSALAMTAAYVLAGELARSEGRHSDAFFSYEQRLRSYVGSSSEAQSILRRRLRPGPGWDCSYATS